MVQIKRQRAELVLWRWGKVTIPVNVVEGGLVLDSEQLAKAMGQLFSSVGVKNPGIMAAIPGQQVVIRHLKLPMMPWKELKNAVHFHALSFLPLSPEETVVDFIPLLGDREFTFSPGKHQSMEVLTVATRRSVVQGWAESFIRAGGTPLALEIEPLALSRTLQTSRLRHKEPSNYLLANLNAQLAQISIFKEGILRYNRVLTISAEIWNPASGGGSAFSNRTATEIWKLVEYYQMENPNEPIEQVYLTGEGMQQLITDQLTRRLNIPVQQLDPLAGLKIPFATPEDLEELRTSYGVALGLAIRGAVTGV